MFALYFRSDVNENVRRTYWSIKWKVHVPKHAKNKYVWTRYKHFDKVSKKLFCSVGKKNKSNLNFEKYIFYCARLIHMVTESSTHTNIALLECEVSYDRQYATCSPDFLSLSFKLISYITIKTIMSNTTAPFFFLAFPFCRTVERHRLHCFRLSNSLFVLHLSSWLAVEQHTMNVNKRRFSWAFSSSTP